MKSSVATFVTSLTMISASLAQTWFEIPSIIYAEPSVSRNFGAVMAIDGDTLVVSDFENFEKGRSYGAAFVYRRDGAVWTREATLSPDDLSFSVDFGTGIAIDGDTLAMGAPGADFTISEGLRGDGQVFVYQREGLEWVGPEAVFPNDQFPNDQSRGDALTEKAP